MAQRTRPPGGRIIPAQALDAVSMLRDQLRGGDGSGGASGGDASSAGYGNGAGSTGGAGASISSGTGSTLVGTPPPSSSSGSAQTPARKAPATETLARRTGALVDEIDFPKFVASLVHGTFDAVLDASIRQMESYAGLVAAVAKTVDQFTEENVTPNHARDWLAQRFPADIRLVRESADDPAPHLEPRKEGLTPVWLADYGAEGEEVTQELLEETVLPQVRTHIGAERQQLLATMVLLGMNRVVVRDGTINAKVMFRAAADDQAQVGYAASADPPSVGTWGERGSLNYAGASTKVSTLSINAQSDTNINAQLFGEVKLNFASETLPLEKLADAAKVALIQRNSPVARAAHGASAKAGTENAQPTATAPAQPPASGGA